MIVSKKKMISGYIKIYTDRDIYIYICRYIKIYRPFVWCPSLVNTVKNERTAIETTKTVRMD